jgi:hypothetical protein
MVGMHVALQRDAEAHQNAMPIKQGHRGSTLGQASLRTAMSCCKLWIHMCDTCEHGCKRLVAVKQADPRISMSSVVQLPMAVDNMLN